MHAGRGNFAIHGAPDDLGRDAAFFYFVDITVARAFVERFACGLAVGITASRWTSLFTISAVAPPMLWSTSRLRAS